MEYLILYVPKINQFDLIKYKAKKLVNQFNFDRLYLSEQFNLISVDLIVDSISVVLSIVQLKADFD